MKIELKNLKTMPSLSEETTAYTATVWIDGKAAFAASNHGHGGGDDYRPLPGYSGPCERDVSIWLREHMDPMPSSWGGEPLEYDLELFVGELIAQQERHKALARLLKKIVVLIEDDGNGQPALASYPAKYKPTPQNLASVAESLSKKGERAAVVNGNPELEARALALV